jgi:hypothetical protein
MVAQALAHTPRHEAHAPARATGGKGAMAGHPPPPPDLVKQPNRAVLLDHARSSSIAWPKI